MFKPVAVISTILFCSVCLSGQEQEKASFPKELIQYVRDAQKAGQNPAQIQQNAVNAGWPPATVTDTMAYVKSVNKEKTPPESDGKTPPPAGSTATEAARPAGTPTVSGEAASPAADTAKPLDKTAEPAGSEPKAAKPTPAPVSPPAEAGGTNPPPRSNANIPDDYQIGAGDILKITVWKEPEASLQSAPVLPTGRISVPLLHEVEAAGLTVPQLEKLLTERFSTILNSPEVSVIVSGMNSKKIYMTGKVKKEGPLPYPYPMTVMQALTEAGGVTDFAKKKGIYVLRTENGRQFQIPFDYAAVLKGKHLETNIQLIPGDMIVVP